MQKEIIDTSMSTAGVATTFTGVSTIGAGALLSSEAAVFYGLVIGVVGLIIQTVFNRRKEHRDAEARAEAKAAHQADMRERHLRIALLESGRLTRNRDDP